MTSCTHTPSDDGNTIVTQQRHYDVTADYQSTTHNFIFTTDSYPFPYLAPYRLSPLTRGLHPLSDSSSLYLSHMFAASKTNLGNSRSTLIVERSGNWNLTLNPKAIPSSFSNIARNLFPNPVVVHVNSLSYILYVVYTECIYHVPHHITAFPLNEQNEVFANR